MYKVSYISAFNGFQETTVEDQDALLALLKSVDHFDGEILDVKKLEDETS